MRKKETRQSPDELLHIPLTHCLLSIPLPGSLTAVHTAKSRQPQPPNSTAWSRRSPVSSLADLLREADLLLYLAQRLIGEILSLLCILLNHAVNIIFILA